MSADEIVPLPELRGILNQFPGASIAEVSKLWADAPVVIAEWVRYHCEYALDTTHPNMQAARLYYVIYALTSVRNRRKREAHRLTAMQIMLPRWDFAAYCKGA